MNILRAKHWQLPVVVASALLLHPAYAQMPAPDETLVYGFHHLYDLDFAAAQKAFAIYQLVRPDDPQGHVAAAAGLLFAEFHRLGVLESQFLTDDDAFLARHKPSPDPAFHERFDPALKQTETLAKARLEHNSRDPDALFALALVSGLRADNAALIEKHNLPALSYGRQASQWAEKLLAIQPDCHDAYVSTGVAKYIIGSLAAPVRWLLELGGYSGDKEKGLAELKLAAQNGRYLAPFARILLAIAYAREQEKPRARDLLTGLKQDFPHNPLFKRELARLDGKMVAEKP